MQVGRQREEGGQVMPPGMRQEAWTGEGQGRRMGGLAGVKMG